MDERRAGRLETWCELAIGTLIENQYWRAAHFRVAADDINYRRFFNINELAGLRMEQPELFDHTHRFASKRSAAGAGWTADRPYRWAARPQGLFPPPARKGGATFYLVVEKILARHEHLREDWPIEGTTGYEFANLVGGLFVDPAGEEAFSRSIANSRGSDARSRTSSASARS